MKRNNEIKMSLRLKELFIDWLVISLYLVILLILALIFYKVVFNGIPEFTEAQSQILAFFTSIVPIVLIFSCLDHRGGSIGKRKSGLVLHYDNKSFKSSLIRNIIKFTPWQLGHMATIHGIYTGYDKLTILIQTLALFGLGLLFAMGTMRKDKRHLGDFLAGTQVGIKE